MSSRDALIDGTKDLLLTQGFEATSPREVQRASGVGKGSFYYHFDSKAALASAALTSLAKDMCDQFDALIDEDGLAVVETFLTLERDALADLAIAAVQGGYVIARATGDSNAQRNATTALLAVIGAHTDKD